MRRLPLTAIVGILCLLVLGLDPARAQTPALSDISTLGWSQPYGRRGQVIPLTVRLVNTGQPLSGWLVGFWDRSDAYGPRFLGYARTDGAGYARLSYMIPTSVFADNVIVTARFNPYWTLPPGTVTFLGSAESSIRIQIGRQYP